MDFAFTNTTTEGYTYQPFTNGYAVGFYVTAPNGGHQIIFLNPSGETDNGFASITLYNGRTDADIDGITGDDDNALFEATAQEHIDLFDIPTTADALARLDMATMAIGDHPTDTEIKLRAAEHTDRLDWEINGSKEVADARRIPSGAEGNVIDLTRVAEWLRLHGVPSTIHHSGGGCWLLLVGERTVQRDGELFHPVSIGSGWHSTTSGRDTYRASTVDCSIGPDDSDAPYEAFTQLHNGITELEVARLAIDQIQQHDANLTRRTNGALLRRVATATTALYPGAKAVHLEPSPSPDGYMLNDVTLPDGSLLSDTDRPGFDRFAVLLHPITSQITDVSESATVHVSQHGAVDIELTHGG